MRQPFKRSDLKPLPKQCEIISTRSGKRMVTWTVRGVRHTKPLAPCGTKYILESPYYSISYRPHDGGRPVVEQTRCTDKSEAERYQRLRQQQEENKRLGIHDEANERAQQSRQQPITAHIDDYVADLRNQRRSSAHVRDIGQKLRAICEAASIASLPDIRLSCVREGIAATCKARGLSEQTYNHYVIAIKSFVNWLCEDGRMLFSPLRKLKQIAVVDRKRTRRVMSLDEFRRLLAAARQRTRPNMKIPGPRREVFYLLLASTGFRISELGSVTPDSFEIVDGDLTISLEAARAKNRKRARRVVPQEIREAVTALLKETPPGERLFPLPSKPAKALERDLAAARRQWIAEAETDEDRRAREESTFLLYRMADGVFADNHAFRAMYCTWVQRFAASHQSVLAAQRHADFRTAQRYWADGDREVDAVQRRIGQELGALPLGPRPRAGEDEGG